MSILSKEIYWARRAKCDQGQHKLRDNKLGITWCVTCGYLSNKQSGIPLKEEDKIYMIPNTQGVVEIHTDINPNSWSIEDVSTE